jgi:hypothetical protein
MRRSARMQISSKCKCKGGGRGRGSISPIQTIPVAKSLLTTHHMFVPAVLLIAVAAAAAAAPPSPPTAAQLDAFAQHLLSDFARSQPNGVLRPQRLRFERFERFERRPFSNRMPPTPTRSHAHTGPTLHGWQGYSVSSQLHSIPALFTTWEVSVTRQQSRFQPLLPTSSKTTRN